MDKQEWIPGLGIPFMVLILAGGVSLMVGLLFPVRGWFRWILAISLFVSVLLAVRRMNQKDPKFMHLWALSLRLGAYYDPALLEDQREYPGID